MNEWPPPSVDDAPSVPPTADAATPWWRHPMAQALLVAWVVGGVIALVAIGFVRAVEPDEAMRPDLTPVGTESSEPEPTASAAGVTVTTTTAATTSATTATTTATTEPLVRSAPPVPTTTDSAAAVTTLVVTLPPTTTLAPPPGDASPPEIDVEINFDAEGDDAANPNGEWVRFTNTGTQPVDMTNWIVRDDGLQNAHVFATLTLEPGSSVTLFSGCGEPTDTERFFCAPGEVWNNEGDVVSLFDSGGVLIVQRRG